MPSLRPSISLLSTAPSSQLPQLLELRVTLIQFPLRTDDSVGYSACLQSEHAVTVAQGCSVSQLLKALEAAAAPAPVRTGSARDAPPPSPKQPVKSLVTPVTRRAARRR